eukprot:TRINITY_DN7261_c0_g1_i1.p1 TRINITY_DN7261_c0_g1~~TRINITY_DN7261_c0_g1_i1.p1  ORF type:complete len:581 (+),score=110.13 TRINITY_DN7261_c0_g1_i1:1280-3022(+)
MLLFLLLCTAGYTTAQETWDIQSIVLPQNHHGSLEFGPVGFSDDGNTFAALDQTGTLYVYARNAASGVWALSFQDLIGCSPWNASIWTWALSLSEDGSVVAALCTQSKAVVADLSGGTAVRLSVLSATFPSGITAQLDWVQLSGDGNSVVLAASAYGNNGAAPVPLYAYQRADATSPFAASVIQPPASCIQWSAYGGPPRIGYSGDVIAAPCMKTLYVFVWTIGSWTLAYQRSLPTLLLANAFGVVSGSTMGFFSLTGQPIGSWEGFPFASGAYSLVASSDGSLIGGYVSGNSQVIDMTIYRQLSWWNWTEIAYLPTIVTAPSNTVSYGLAGASDSLNPLAFGFTGVFSPNPTITVAHGPIPCWSRADCMTCVQNTTLDFVPYGCTWCLDSMLCIDDADFNPHSCPDYITLPPFCPASPPPPPPCYTYLDCTGCVTESNGQCYFCLDNLWCVNSTDTCSDFVKKPQYCPAPPPPPPPPPPPVNCAAFPNCTSCASNKACGYCLDTSTCVAQSDPSCSDMIRNPTFCPAPPPPCSSYSTCKDCVTLGTSCEFCLDTSSCIADGAPCHDVIHTPAFCPGNRR